MTPRRRRLLIALVAIPLLLVVSVVAFAHFVLPGLLRKQVSRYVLEHSGHHVDFDPPQIQVFAPHVHLANLSLSEPDGKPLLAFASLDVGVAFLPLLTGDVHVTDLRLAKPHATVKIRPDGRLNWSTLIERLQAAQAPAPVPPPPPGKPTPVEIDALAVTGAEIDAADERVGFAASTTPLDLTLSHLSTTGDTGGHYRLSAVTSVGARIAVEGDALLKTFHTQGTLQVDDLQLGALAPLLDAHAPVRVPTGVASLQTGYSVSWQNAQLGLALDALKLSLRDLTVQQARAGSPTVKVGAVSVDQGHFDLVPGQAQLGSLKVEQVNVSLPRANGAPAELALGGLSVEQVSADLPQHQAKVAKVTLSGGRLQATRGQDGHIDLLDAIQAAKGGAAPGAEPGAPGAAVTTPKASESAPAAPSAAASAGTAPGAPAGAGNAAPWHFAVAQFALAGFQLRFRDESVQPAAEFAIDPLHAEVEGISDDLKQALQVHAGFQATSGGTFDVQGQVVPGTPAADLRFRLEQLALVPAQPYLHQFARLDIAGGAFSTSGQLKLADASGPHVQGDFGLDKLRLVESGTTNLFFGLASFGTHKFTATSKRVDIPQLNLAGLDTQLLIAKDKSTNLSRILVAGKGAGATPAGAKDSSTAAKAAPEAGSAAAKSDSAAFQANVDQLRIADSALDFADQSLALPFGTRIHQLHGVINGLSTRKDARGQVQLDGQVDDYGSAHAEGQLDLFNPTGFMDLKVIFRNVEMTRLTPYSATFAGRRIASGKLSLDLGYKIHNRQLEGDNQVVMDKLTLGEKVDAPGATNLPLDLAIAILSDSDGRIDLGLPVSGSLDDPQFSYGRIIWKAIVNVIGKIVLSPFRALGSLFGGSGEKFESVLFAPGTATLAPPEREKLRKIAAALSKRPAITLAVPGAFSDTDRTALQDLQVRRAIAARAGQAVAADDDPGPVALRSPDVQAAIEAEFSARLGAEALAPLRKAAQPADGSALPDSYYQDLITRMRNAQPVADTDLQALGAQRAVAVATGLRSAGMAENRVSAGAAAKVDLQDGSVPLKLAPGTAAATP